MVDGDIIREIRGRGRYPRHLFTLFGRVIKGLAEKQGKSAKYFFGLST
jgi:hypothetical protein